MKIDVLRIAKQHVIQQCILLLMQLRMVGLQKHMVQAFDLLLLGFQHTDLPDSVPYWLHCSWYHRAKV